MTEDRDETRWEEQEVRLLDLAVVPLRWWRTILLSVVGAIVVGLVLWALLPRTYRAEIVLLPLAGDRGRGAPELARLMSRVPIDLDLAPGGTPQEIVVVILRSRSVADSIARRLRLGEAWEIDDDFKVRKALRQHTDVQLDEQSGAIEIQIEDPDAELASLIANAYPQALNRISARLASDEALARQEFFERQIALARHDLEGSEDRLVEFLRTNEVPAVEEQAKASIDAAAGLQRRIIEKEVEIAQLRRFSTGENPRLQRALSELAALRGELSGITSAGGSGAGDVFLSFREAPEIGVNYARLLREYEKDQQVFMTLTAGLAEARLNAGTTMPVVMVLDPAIPPERPDALSPLLVVVLSGLTGLVAGLVVAGTGTWIASARDDDRNRDFFLAWSRFRSDVSRRLPGGSRSGN